MAADLDRTFRARTALKLALAGAGIFWLAIFCALLPMGGIAGHSLLTCAAFVAFFGAMWAYYARMRITVGARELDYRNLWRRVRIPLSDVLRVEVNDVLLFKTYLVATRRGPILFSSHVARHAELFRLLTERARLQTPA